MFHRGDSINPAEKHEMKGNVKVILRDREGRIVQSREVKNLIVSSGKRLIADLFRGEESQPATHIAVGTGRSVPGSTDVTLEEELPPRCPFDKNFLSDETSAYLVLKDAAKKDVLKVTSRLGGEKGNTISVEMSRAPAETFDLIVHGETDVEFIQEEYKDISMDAGDKNFVENVVDKESQLIHAKRLVNSVPENMERTNLANGVDTMVTLGVTFDYGECNGPITEAGIFNAEREGTMYNRVVFPEINKTDKLTLSLIWKISF